MLNCSRVSHLYRFLCKWRGLREAKMGLQQWKR
uniref:Uncharacterized protein n=1 Tax=Rhizophora mucronata TaxID=61149 RepID=A0A2P2NB20_RHIMU